VRRGDVVALLLPSTPLYPVAYLAAARLGAITTGINVRYRRTEIGHVLGRAAPRLLLAVDRWHETDFRTMVDALPGASEVERVWLPADAVRGGTAAIVDGLAGDAPPPCTAPDDPVAIVFTSGTTGVPKGAWYAHRSLMAVADIEARRQPAGTPPVRTHLAAGLSFAHVGTMARIAIQLRNHTTSLLQDAFDPALVLETIERHRLAHLGAFPTQMVMLLDHPDRARRDLSSLRTVLLGGAPSSPALIRRAPGSSRMCGSTRRCSDRTSAFIAPRMRASRGRHRPRIRCRLVTCWCRLSAS
jgi:acyl-CoA synthetase (AMP-forming)/AMP-acid ligase II